MFKSVYTQVAQNCSSFDPRMNMFKSAPDAGEPTCINCKHFKNDHCNLDLFDVIRSNIE